MISDKSMAKEPLLRNKIADYINVATDSTAKYVLCGAGFTQLDENPNAQEYESAYVNDSSTSTFVKGYKPEFPYNCDMMADDEAIAALYAVGRDLLTGTDAMFEYVRVDLYKGASSSNVYPARKFIVSAIPASTTGEGAGYISTTGTLKAVGDPVQGTFNTQSKTFTATGTTAQG